MEQPGRGSSVQETVLDDEHRLADLGYKQELTRDWSVLHNFGVSFSIISVITGVSTLLGYGLTVGGPGVMTTGWIVVSFFTMSVGLSMAEIVSAIPTAGGPYFWAATLAPPRYAPFLAWFTGWFNFVGQFAVTCGITFGCAGLISATASVNNPGFVASPGKTIAIYAALLVSHVLINCFGVHVLRYLNNSSIILHSFGVASLAIALVAKAPTHQSAKFVFATFYDGTGDPGWSIRASPEYVAICGVLLSQYTITGFDASAHLSEETHNAARNAPIGVLTSIGVSAIFGFFLMLCVLFSIQDFQATVKTDYGYPIVQIFVDVFGKKGAMAAMTLVIMCVWHCGLFSLTSNSRMMFAFSRDGALPNFFDAVDAKRHAPVRTICLAALLAFILSLPSLGSAVAFAAATSIATIGLYISYATPVFVAVLWPQYFIRGPFHLGKFSRPIGIIACAWVGFITVVFCLPTTNPVTSQTVNYTPVAVGTVLIFILLTWFLWAHKWFTGPRRQVEFEAASAGITDPSATVVAEKGGIIGGENKLD